MFKKMKFTAEEFVAEVQRASGYVVIATVCIIFIVAPEISAKGLFSLIKIFGTMGLMSIAAGVLLFIKKKTTKNKKILSPQ